MADRQIRIFHLIKGLGLGGAERLLSRSLECSTSGRFVYGCGYFLPGKDALAPQLRAAGADVRCFEARTPMGILLRLGAVTQTLRRWEADLVHCHLPMAGVVGRLAARRARLPLVYTEHNRSEMYHPLTRSLNRATWGLQDQVIAVSHDAAASIARQFGSAVPLRVIHNRVATDALTVDTDGAARVRRTMNLAPEALVIGQVAVFRRQKRLDLWLQAAAEIRRQRANTAFLLVGDGPTRPEVERLAEQLGLASVIRFAGLQEDVVPYLSACDIVLAASDWEGLPVALLEAMALERPVVATAVGGVPEVVDSGRNGLLVRPGDPRELAAAALLLVDDPALRRRLGVAARRRIGEGFGIAPMVRALESLYEEVLERPRRIHPGSGLARFS